MEKHFKLKISKLFQTSFYSCQKKHSDVSDHHQFAPKNPQNRRLIDIFSPKPKPHLPPSIKPKTHFPANPTRRSSYSVSPIYEKPSKNHRKKKTHIRKRSNSLSFSSVTDNNYYNWWDSDSDDDEKQSTLFFRPSFSSSSGHRGCGGDRRMREGVDSSGFGVLKESNYDDEKQSNLFFRRDFSGGDGDGRMIEVVEMDGFAVTKESNDIYEDFRISMVDMIVEKGIFGVEELENLVECFVKLNSEEHHKVIFEVFAEIWESLVCET